VVFTTFIFLAKKGKPEKIIKAYSKNNNAKYHNNKLQKELVIPRIEPSTSAQITLRNLYNPQPTCRSYAEKILVSTDKA
jgi:hypothetical protein